MFSLYFFRFKMRSYQTTIHSKKIRAFILWRQSILIFCAQKSEISCSKLLLSEQKIAPYKMCDIYCSWCASVFIIILDCFEVINWCPKNRHMKLHLILIDEFDTTSICMLASSRKIFNCYECNNKVHNKNIIFV